MWHWSRCKLQASATHTNKSNVRLKQSQWILNIFTAHRHNRIRDTITSQSLTHTHTQTHTRHGQGRRKSRGEKPTERINFRFFAFHTHFICVQNSIKSSQVQIPPSRAASRPGFTYSAWLFFFFFILCFSQLTIAECPTVYHVIKLLMELLNKSVSNWILF